MNWKRPLYVALIAGAVVALGWCQAHGETLSVLIQFRSPAEIAALQAKECAEHACDNYAAKAATINSQSAKMAVIWMPNDRTIDLRLLQHELCHLQLDPNDPTKFKHHDANGVWAHTLSKSKC